jgi:alpha-1,3-glucan synthase
MMFFVAILLYLGLAVEVVTCLRYAPEYARWNLNTNQEAIHPLDYSGTWENHTYNKSPQNWRFPVYTLFLDRWVNGDPTNDNANGTLFEQDITSTQFRHGGDIQGLIDSLDYIQGFGIKVSDTPLDYTHFKFTDNVRLSTSLDHPSSTCHGSPICTR